MLVFFPERAVALSIFGWDIHWYGVFYLISFLLAIWLAPKLQQWRNFQLPRAKWFEIVTYAAIGVIVGGRLGYVLFYEPLYFLNNPAEIFFLSYGGMSLHGGLIGVGLITWIIARQEEISWLALLDVSVPLASLGIALGRVGNIVNQELFLSPLGFFLAPVGPLAIAALSFWVLQKNQRPGAVVVVFLLLSSGWRFTIEYLREQPFSTLSLFSRGQLLSLLLALTGVLLGLYVRSGSNQKTTN